MGPQSKTQSVCVHYQPRFTTLDSGMEGHVGRLPSSSDEREQQYDCCECQCSRCLGFRHRQRGRFGEVVSRRWRCSCRDIGFPSPPFHPILSSLYTIKTQQRLPVKLHRHCHRHHHTNKICIVEYNKRVKCCICCGVPHGNRVRPGRRRRLSTITIDHPLQEPKIKMSSTQDLQWLLTR